MLRLVQKIIIGDMTLPFCSTVEIVTSRNNFTDTAKITLPNRISSNNKKISDIIAIGSEVTISLGYNRYGLTEEFNGYVSQIIPEKTAVIYCEDESYNAKRQSIGTDLILKNTDLETLIGKCYSGTTSINNSNIGDWKVSKNSTVIEVLSELKNKFKIYSYFRGSTLVVGVDADTHDSEDIICHFQKNIPAGESSFNFKDADSDKIVVKVTNINRVGKINTIYAYYSGSNIVYYSKAPSGGAINEFHIGGQTALTTSDLKSLAKTRLEALSFTGCDGTITIYGYPSAQHGDIAKVTDTEVPEKDGDYSIIEVTKRFGIGIGYRQDLTVGIEL